MTAEEHDWRRLTEAVEHFLWWSGCSERLGDIEDAVLYTASGSHRMGTKTIDHLAEALQEHGHSSVRIRESADARKDN